MTTTTASAGQNALVELYILLWFVLSTVNMHSCIGRSRASQRAWSPAYPIGVIARMMCDVLFARHYVYVHVVSVCMLAELAMLFHLTTSPRKHSFPPPDALGHTGVLCMLVTADAVLACYLYTLGTPMLGRVDGTYSTGESG